MKKGTIITICVIAILVIACIIGFAVSKNKTSNNANEVEEKETTIENGTTEENSEEPENSENEEALVEETSTENSESNNETSSDKKTLVVYYSAQNHTKEVAEKIAKNLNADIFEIEPKEKYTTEDLDWTDNDSRVNKEHNDESQRNVELKTTEVPNWDNYDTVLIGYPIWWGIAAWPTNSFVKANDFTGKTVYAFCTSQSSGLGQSMKLLQQDAKGGDWKDGQRFSSNASDSDIKKWTDDLNL